MTRISRHFRPLPVAAIGMLTYALGVGSVALMKNFWGFWASMVFMTFGELILIPTVSKYIADLMMSFFADKIFLTLFSDKLTMMQVHEAASILSAFVLGLFFASSNKILLNIYYALRNTKVPAIISAITIVSNIIFNKLLIGSLQATGLALATTLSWSLQTLMFVLCLHYLFDVKVYFAAFANFFARYAAQLAAFGSLFFGIYKAIEWAIEYYLASYANHLLQGIEFWLWVGPLCLAFFLLTWYTRRLFGLRIYFLD